MWSSGKRSVLYIGIIVLVAVIYPFLSYLYYSHTPYYNNYISDEIWYVDSARNLLYLFGYEPRQTTPYTATVFLRPEADIDRFIERLENYSGVSVVTTLSQVKAVYISYREPSEIYSIERDPDVRYVRIGYVYGDARDIDKYYNLEHPPLAKYFIMFSMYLVGDSPWTWRLPSYILGSLKVFLIGVFVYIVTRDPLFGVLGAVIQALDPVNIYMDGLAMLEPYVSFFTVMAAMMIATRSYLLGGLLIGLAGASKMSGFFISLPALFVSETKRRIEPLVYFILIPLLVYLFVNIPVILVFGPEYWWSNSVVGAISWHLSTKTRPGEGPPISTPWDWLLGANPFYVTVSPDTPIRGNVIIYLGAIVLSLALLPVIKRYRETATIVTLTYGTWLGYVILWLAGNHSQYSFYMAHISPLFGLSFTLLLYVLYREYRGLTEIYRDMVRRVLSLMRHRTPEDTGSTS